jgi:hypothetical protein
MGEITAVPVLALIMAVWAFLKFLPVRGTPHSQRVFNALVLGLGCVLWVGWFYTITDSLTRMGLLKYKYLFGIGGGASGFLVYLGIFFLVRNFWIFADNKPRPGKW